MSAEAETAHNETLKKKPATDRHPRLQGLADAVPISAVARLMGVSSRTVQRWIAGGHLEPFYLPGSASRSLVIQRLRTWFARQMSRS